MLANYVKIWALGHCRDMDFAGRSKSKPAKIEENLPLILSWIEGKVDSDLAFDIIKRLADINSPKLVLEALLHLAETDYKLFDKPNPVKPSPKGKKGKGKS